VPRTVTIVPHTHWDREWYAPFDTFRMRLVELLDELLPRLEADEGYAHFMLDGQMAVVDDYLAVRPEAEPALRRLADAGRLALGPWYVLMDEFLVSGETIVRDLQAGLRRAEAFGGAMAVGYLPDMFGHVAQMPQVLAGFGLEHAVVWRGVPAAVDRSGFWWEAPDGSTVRAEYLPEGYGNGAALPADGAGLVEAVRRFERDHGDVLVGPILWMNGTDHLVPQPWLARVVAEANAAQDELRFVVGGLADHLAAAPVDGLPRWRGELRSGARSNLLMGVASNRVDVKQAAARAEAALERSAEPLSALFLAPGCWPGAFLDRAWHRVVLDAAHDSSCACSADEVVDAVLGRYAVARQIAEGLVERATAALAASLRDPGVVVVNPTARARRGLTELLLYEAEPVPGTQDLEVHDGRSVVEGIDRAECVQLVQRALDELPYLRRASASVDPAGTLTVRIEHDPTDRRTRYAGPIRSEVAALAADEPASPARLEVVGRPSRRVLALVDVPGHGWTTWHPGPIEAAAVAAERWAADGAPDGTGAPALTNGLLRLEVDVERGTFSLRELTGARRRVEGLDRLVDDGDAGDTYNWSPPGDDRVVDEPTSVEVRLVEAGPLRGRIEVRRAHRWPAEVRDGARVGDVEVEVVTSLVVEATSPLVRITTELDNRTRDHRLRTWFPLPERSARSQAECAFAVVERTTVAEGGPTEAALPTYPSRRFVAAGGLVVVHQGLLEYELVDLAPNDEGDGPPTAGALALTLLRCTGTLSNGPMAMRPLPAGPELPTPGAQLPGRRVLRYGVGFGPPDGGPVASVGHPLADELTVPLLVTLAGGGGHRPATGSALPVDGAEVSAVRRVDGALEVRVFNPTADPVVVSFGGRAGRRVDLRGRDLGPFERSLDLRPWEIATVVLDET
jgi:hypothetical protein